MTFTRQIEPQEESDPVLTFMVASIDHGYPDNESEVIVIWLADGKRSMSGGLAVSAAFSRRAYFGVPTSETKHLTTEQLHEYISKRPYLWDKNYKS